MLSSRLPRIVRPLTIVGLVLIASTAEAVASGFHHHGVGTVLVASPRQVAYPAAYYVPAVPMHAVQVQAAPTAGSVVQYAPAMPQVQAVQAAHVVQLVPTMQQTVTATWAPTVQMVPPVAAPAAPAAQLQLGSIAPTYSLQASPVNVSVNAAPSQNYGIQYVAVQAAAMPGTALIQQAWGGVQAAGSASGAVSDLDYQILTAGFGGSHHRLHGLIQFLRNRLELLIRQKGGLLSEQELTTLLLDAAKAFMLGNGFGFLINEAVEPIIKRLIAQLLRDRQTSTPSAPNEDVPAPPAPPGPGPRPGGDIPSSGAITFEVSGRIILTPTGGTLPDPPSTPVEPPPVRPEPQPVRPEPQPVRPEPNPGTMPNDLKNEGGRVAPSPS